MTSLFDAGKDDASRSGLGNVARQLLVQPNVRAPDDNTASTCDSAKQCSAPAPPQCAVEGQDSGDNA